ncbi:MAG: mobile mystery protein A [Candidatus Obscuribacter sp.]|jgi:predicted DNA-binding mobile mystery protein A|nr:mobile mystery protein A [Candidatus Obscuribacter sp.]MBK7841600.1 mobile mystery protein A [Candidatus Obscuribacter sp.]MBK9205405.1 mobile mystery protein A [Candidatus Obscuribacter sp.]MBK9620534.1 mobile mystery protein A [Candidatus Obscuribacter sp.]MBK9772558.1 mobile mystery protein A [Candidatus Obscuribacter sp.]
MTKFTTKLRRRQLEEGLKGLRGVSRLPHGYIREIRDALEMSSYQLADRMGVSQSTVMDLEASERNGTITIKSLEKAAAALGCKLVYALVPEVSLEQMVTNQAQLRARELSNSVFRTMALEQQTTETAEQNSLIDELAEDLLRKGKRELWKHDK